jgi:hypothetical protein
MSDSSMTAKLDNMRSVRQFTSYVSGVETDAGYSAGESDVGNKKKDGENDDARAELSSSLSGSSKDSLAVSSPKMMLMVVPAYLLKRKNQQSTCDYESLEDSQQYKRRRATRKPNNADADDSSTRAMHETSSTVSSLEACVNALSRQVTEATSASLQDGLRQRESLSNQILANVLSLHINRSCTTATSPAMNEAVLPQLATHLSLPNPLGLTVQQSLVLRALLSELCLIEEKRRQLMQQPHPIFSIDWDSLGRAWNNLSQDNRVLLANFLTRR